jgi:hypothetical protein
LRILECTNAASARIYWCEPGKSVADVLRSLKGDADIIAMSNMTSTCKNILMYINHLNFLESQARLPRRQHCDDIFHDETQHLQQVDHTSSEKKSNCAEKTRKVPRKQFR